MMMIRVRVSESYGPLPLRHRYASAALVLAFGATAAVSQMFIPSVVAIWVKIEECVLYFN